MPINSIHPTVVAHPFLLLPDSISAECENAFCTEDDEGCGGIMAMQDVNRRMREMRMRDELSASVGKGGVRGG